MTRQPLTKGVGRTGCSPRPLIKPCVVDVGPEPGKPPDERFVLAVNVWPYPDQPVGVTYSVQGKKGLPSDFGEAIKFPIRIALRGDAGRRQLLGPLLDRVAGPVEARQVLLRRAPQFLGPSALDQHRRQVRGMTGPPLLACS